MYVHMYGVEIGELRVTANGPDGIFSLWSISASQDDEWHRVNVTIPKGVIVNTVSPSIIRLFL